MNLRFNFLIMGLLLLWRNQHSLGTTVNVYTNDTTCVGNNITLTCAIDNFTSFASWSRVESELTTCTASGFCTTFDLIISRTLYSFSGSLTGLQVSFKIPLVEDGIIWNCRHNAIHYSYKFNVSQECTTTTPPPTTTTTSAPTSLKECIFFQAERCLLNNVIVCAIIMTIFVIALSIIGYIKWKRNRQKSGKEKKRKNSKENTSDHSDQNYITQDHDRINMNVSLDVSENSRKHKTDKYHISQIDEGLIVRRGQDFDITIDFGITFDEQHDELKLIFYFGTNKSQYVIIKCSGENKDGWEAWKKKPTDTNQLTIQIKTPETCAVGIWTLEIEAAVKSENIQLKYFVDKHIYILFNPWCKGDMVYFPKEDLLNEYILNDVGTISIGNYKNISERKWIFGQFEENILDCAMHLLDTHFSSWSDRGDPVKISRKISEFVNSTDGNGILSGKWDDCYTDGKTPSTWIGSVAILNEYYITRKPVRYGQCWVFSGLATTLCRTLGIPARSVTGFDTVHYYNCSSSINKFWTEDGELTQEGVNDSVWNFHVWNDVWMKRPNLGVKYGEWQALDATPLPLPDGKYRSGCGPASLKAIQDGAVDLDHDTKFFFNEVNAVIAHWITFKSDDNENVICLIDIENNRIGRSICTKMHNKTVQEDTKNTPSEDDIITKKYKCKTKNTGNSKEEEQAIIPSIISELKKKMTGEMKINSLSQWRSDNSYPVKNDVDFKVNEHKTVTYSDRFVLTLNIINNSEEDRTIVGCISKSSMYYHGKAAENVKKEIIKEEIKKHKDKKISFEVTYEDYRCKVVDQYHMLVTCMCRVKETNQVFVHYDTFCMSKPTLNIKVSKTIKSLDQSGWDVEAEVTFVNPLSCQLTDCEIKAESPGLLQTTVIQDDLVQAKETFVAKLWFHSEKRTTSDVIVLFNSKELKMVEGSCKIDIKKNTHRQ